MTPQQRSLIKLRQQGYTVDTVEKWQRFPKGYPCPRCQQRPVISVRRDLFGYVDILALGKGETLLVQVTSGSNHSSRVEKILNDPQVSVTALKCLKAGARIFVHSWAKKGLRGEAKHWTLRSEEITEDMVSTVAHCALAAELPPQMELIAQ